MSPLTRNRNGYTLVELLIVTGIIIILAAVMIPTAYKTLNSAKKLLPQVQLASDIYDSSLLPNMEYSNSSLLNKELVNRTASLEKIINETGVNQYPDVSNSSDSNITHPKVYIEVYYKVYFIDEATGTKRSSLYELDQLEDLIRNIKNNALKR